MHTGDFFQVFGQFGVVKEVDSHRDAVFVLFDQPVSADRAKAHSPYKWNGRLLHVGFASSDRYLGIARPYRSSKKRKDDSHHSLPPP